MPTEKPADDMIVFFVPGPPVGKGRPRAARRGKHIALYTPEKTASYESLVALAAHRAMGGRKSISGPAKAHVSIAHPIPASWSKKRRDEALRGGQMPTGKPDLDNVIKAIFDAINGIVWGDDAQVVYLSAIRFYSESPGVRVEVGPVGGAA